MSDKIIQHLLQLSTVPLDDEKFKEWLHLQDAIDFLKQNGTADDVVIYANAQFTYMHSVLAPNTPTVQLNVDDLLAWDFDPSGSWGISVESGETPQLSVAAPLQEARNGAYKGGEQIVFSRYFERRLGEKHYFEISQKFVQISELHFMPERNAFCRLDKTGDIENVVRIIEVPERGGLSHASLVICKRDVLDKYAAVTDCVVVQTFDFTRYRPNEFSGWSDTLNRERINDGSLHYEIFMQSGYASFMRGIQIIHPAMAKEAIAHKLLHGEKEERQYASFIIQDWKNEKLVEISSAPGSTANYFTQSDLPFDTSPAFFRPEVLAKYKSDSEKYRIEPRSITCHGTWHLKGYDINEHGQVHAYLYDLRNLPYEEQLHWKAYNEKPKGPISKRAFTADFEGKWDLGYDPLIKVKASLASWRERSVPWWTLRNSSLPDQVHYPVTSSADEWADEILRLDQLIVEGFEEKWLRQKAKDLGKAPDASFRSLKLAEECLVGIGFEQDHARTIVSPLQELHLLRSKLKGHAAGDEALEIKKRILTKDGTYKSHFRALCSKIDEAIEIVGDAFAKLR